MSLAPGTRLGSFEIVGMLGAGGMGVVYRAHDPRLERDVALKLLPAEYAADPERRARFEREARAAAALSRPNICTIHEIGAVDGQLYITIELLEGATLTECLATRPAPTATGEVLDIGVQIADGALRLIQTCVDRGVVPDYDWLVLDTRLAPLRTNPRFKTVLDSSRVEFGSMLKDVDAARSRGEFPAYLEQPLKEMRAKVGM